MNGHLVISSPDFEFPIPIVLPYDPPSIETGGKALIAAWLQIGEYLKELSLRRDTHPYPKKVREIFPKVVDEVALGEACRILGMKPDMVRYLANTGTISSTRTPRGHRRFSRMQLQSFLENYRNNSGNGSNVSSKEKK
jgi:excisionase family DNA binding protein